MATWRVTVKGGGHEELETFKEAHFKQLYDAAGDHLTFEFPEALETAADDLIAAAEASGLVAGKERFDDPLEDAGAVDFW